MLLQAEGRFFCSHLSNTPIDRCKVTAILAATVAAAAADVLLLVRLSAWPLASQGCAISLVSNRLLAVTRSHHLQQSSCSHHHHSAALGRTVTRRSCTGAAHVQQEQLWAAAVMPRHTLCRGRQCWRIVAAPDWRGARCRACSGTGCGSCSAAAAASPSPGPGSRVCARKDENLPHSAAEIGHRVNHNNDWLKQQCR